MSTKADAALARLREMGVASYDAQGTTEEKFFVLYDGQGKTIFPVKVTKKLIATLKEHYGHSIRKIIFSNTPLHQMQSQGVRFQSSTGEEFLPPVT
jgi:hypothetical protein